MGASPKSAVAGLSRRQEGLAVPKAGDGCHDGAIRCLRVVWGSVTKPRTEAIKIVSFTSSSPIPRVRRREQGEAEDDDLRLKRYGEDWSCLVNRFERGKSARPSAGRSPAAEPPAMQWDAFISHAAEDKESIARPLALRLQTPGLVVWYDEFTLRVGDSLRRTIDFGLARSQYGIVILSHNFFNKQWPQKELDGLVAREKFGQKVILPVWYNITQDEVAAYSPTLADLYAANAGRGIEQVVENLIAAMTLPRVGSAREEDRQPSGPMNLRPGSSEEHGTMEHRGPSSLGASRVSTGGGQRHHRIRSLFHNTWFRGIAVGTIAAVLGGLVFYYLIAGLRVSMFGPTVS
ncbi:MAG: hypothetical protein QOH66_1512, partial [Actinomycetota bacterium]|nr:hypothetical protein [Actinomycetota bacterium]